MTISGIDYFTRLTTTLKTLAARQREHAKQFPAGYRHNASSHALMKLAEALSRLPPESHQRSAYNSVMDQAAVLNLGLSIEDIERDHVEEYCLNHAGGGGPGPFLESLIADIESAIDDADLDANEDAAEEAASVHARANEIARGIASKKAEDGAREAAEEAYRLAYQWAYEDIFDEAYDQALSQLIEPPAAG